MRTYLVLKPFFINYENLWLIDFINLNVIKDFRKNLFKN
jgi:hypothetical protein